MNLTETQKRIINELTNEFETINHQFNKDNGNIKLFNPIPIVNNVLENVRQLKELEAHNKAMYEQTQQMYSDICAMLNDDLKDVPMVCVEKKNFHSHETYGLAVNPIDKNGIVIDLYVTDALLIDIKIVNDFMTIGNKSYHKYTAFKFGSSDHYFKTIKEYTNSPYFKNKFGEIYNKHCIPCK